MKLFYNCCLIAAAVFLVSATAFSQDPWAEQQANDPITAPADAELLFVIETNLDEEDLNLLDNEQTSFSVALNGFDMGSLNPGVPIAGIPFSDAGTVSIAVELPEGPLTERLWRVARLTCNGHAVAVSENFGIVEQQGDGIHECVLELQRVWNRGSYQIVDSQRPQVELTPGQLPSQVRGGYERCPRGTEPVVRGTADNPGSLGYQFDLDSTRAAEMLAPDSDGDYWMSDSTTVIGWGGVWCVPEDELDEAAHQASIQMRLCISDGECNDGEICSSSNVCAPAPPSDDCRLVGNECDEGYVCMQNNGQCSPELPELPEFPDTAAPILSFESVEFGTHVTSRYGAFGIDGVFGLRLRIKERLILVGRIGAGLRDPLADAPDRRFRAGGEGMGEILLLGDFDVLNLGLGWGYLELAGRLTNGDDRSEVKQHQAILQLEVPIFDIEDDERNIGFGFGARGWYDSFEENIRTDQRNGIGGALEFYIEPTEWMRIRFMGGGSMHRF